MASRDFHKYRFLRAFGIHLIVVPFWWDGEMASLATTIKEQRPDIEIPEKWRKTSMPKLMPKQEEEKGRKIFNFAIANYLQMNFSEIHLKRSAKLNV